MGGALPSPAGARSSRPPRGCALSWAISGRPWLWHERSGVELVEVARTKKCDGEPVRPEPGYPAECLRHHSLQSRVAPSSRIPSGPAVEKRPQRQAGHKTAPDQPSNIKSPLATREPSTQDIRAAAEGYRLSCFMPPSFTRCSSLLRTKDGHQVCFLRQSVVGPCRKRD